MKSMKCKQLGGPKSCEFEFKAETWEEMKNQSMSHGRKMFAKEDQAHIEAGKSMREKMQNPNAMQMWMDEKKKVFEELPNLE